MPTKPRQWSMTDIPAPPGMEEYLSRIQAARDAFRGVAGFPPLPPDMDKLTFEEANDIERVLLRVHETIGKLENSRIYSGELQAGGV